MASSSYNDQLSGAPLLEFHHFSSCTGRKSCRPSCTGCSSCWSCRLKGFFLSIRALASSSCKAVWHGAALQDPSKTIHALKMALALVLAFLLVLLQAPYEQLGGHAIWAIITVVVVFEFTTGATVSKGLNRGAGTLLAGVLAVAVGEFAELGRVSGGGIGQRILIELSVFIIGGVVTFVKLWPSMKSYEYGFRTFLITFCLITVVEYQEDKSVTTAVKRFLVILLGAAIGIVVNVFVLPCWAGEDLHRCIVNNFFGVAESLEVCVNEYLRGTTLETLPSKMLQGLVADDPVYKGYQSTLISASKEESLAGFARWEPPHGRFKMIKYPWHLYVKVGALLRHCAYSIVALHSCLWSPIQRGQMVMPSMARICRSFKEFPTFYYMAPVEVRKIFENELREVSMEGALVLRKLGRQVEDMHKGGTPTTLCGIQHAVDRLQQRLYLHSYLLVRQQTGILDESAENISVSVIPEITRSHNDEKSANPPTSLQAQSASRRGIAYPHGESTDCSSRHVKRLHSWPLRPMDDFDFTKESIFEQRVRVLESASALSLGTFATLLMELAFRLDYVVKAVEELAELANFDVVKDNIDTDIKVQIDGDHPHTAVEGGLQACT